MGWSHYPWEITIPSRRNSIQAKDGPCKELFQLVCQQGRERADESSFQMAKRELEEHKKSSVEWLFSGGEAGERLVGDDKKVVRDALAVKAVLFRTRLCFSCPSEDDKLNGKVGDGATVRMSDGDESLLKPSFDGLLPCRGDSSSLY